MPNPTNPQEEQAVSFSETGALTQAAFGNTFKRLKPKSKTTGSKLSKTHALEVTTLAVNENTTPFEQPRLPDNSIAVIGAKLTEEFKKSFPSDNLGYSGQPIGTLVILRSSTTSEASIVKFIPIKALTSNGQNNSATIVEYLSRVPGTPTTIMSLYSKPPHLNQFQVIRPLREALLEEGIDCGVTLSYFTANSNQYIYRDISQVLVNDSAKVYDFVMDQFKESLADLEQAIQTKAVQKSSKQAENEFVAYLISLYIQLTEKFISTVLEDQTLSLQIKSQLNKETCDLAKSTRRKPALNKTREVAIELVGQILTKCYLRKDHLSVGRLSFEESPAVIDLPTKQSSRSTVKKPPYFLDSQVSKLLPNLLEATNLNIAYAEASNGVVVSIDVLDSTLNPKELQQHSKNENLLISKSPLKYSDLILGFSLRSKQAEQTPACLLELDLSNTPFVTYRYVGFNSQLQDRDLETSLFNIEALRTKSVSNLKPDSEVLGLNGRDLYTRLKAQINAVEEALDRQLGATIDVNPYFKVAYEKLEQNYSKKQNKFSIVDFNKELEAFIKEQIDRLFYDYAAQLNIIVQYQSSATEASLSLLPVKFDGVSLSELLTSLEVSPELLENTNLKRLCRDLNKLAPVAAVLKPVVKALHLDYKLDEILSPMVQQALLTHVQSITALSQTDQEQLGRQLLTARVNEELFSQQTPKLSNNPKDVREVYQFLQQVPTTLVSFEELAIQIQQPINELLETIEDLGDEDVLAKKDRFNVYCDELAELYLKHLELVIVWVTETLETTEKLLSLNSRAYNKQLNRSGKKQKKSRTTGSKKSQVPKRETIEKLASECATLLATTEQYKSKLRKFDLEQLIESLAKLSSEEKNLDKSFTEIPTEDLALLSTEDKQALLVISQNWEESELNFLATQFLSLLKAEVSISGEQLKHLYQELTKEAPHFIGVIVEELGKDKNITIFDKESGVFFINLDRAEEFTLPMPSA